MIVGLLLGGVTTTVNAEKQTKRIYESDYAHVPSPALRNAFAGATIHHLEEMGEENRAKDAQELLDNYGLIKKSDMKYLDVVETEFFDEDTFIEGAQYVENAKGVYIEFGNISDFRPLSNLTKVEELEIGVGGSIPDLSDFSKLTKVKRINIQLYANKSVMGEKGSGITNNLALLDISALNNMPNLENVLTLKILMKKRVMKVKSFLNLVGKSRKVIFLTKVTQKSQLSGNRQINGSKHKEYGFYNFVLV